MGTNNKSAPRYSETPLALLLSFSLIFHEAWQSLIFHEDWQSLAGRKVRRHASWSLHSRRRIMRPRPYLQANCGRAAVARGPEVSSFVARCATKKTHDNARIAWPRESRMAMVFVLLMQRSKCVA